MKTQENIRQLAGRDGKTTARRRWIVAAVSSSQILSFEFLGSNPAFSQIVPDNTLPVPSQVNLEGNRYSLEGGTEAGSNLFHSFQDFSVPTGSEAFFNNATRIENILTRVTGGNLSHIDGLIRANGSANLFLLNPNGIVFGPNARLDIGGSFFGTTANSLVFENGLEFSATSPEARPLLTVSAPVGLQFNGQGGAIQVRGEGHGFTAVEARVSPISRNNHVRGLQVSPGHTLALAGGDALLDGGVLTAESGRIELGGVEEGFVRLIAPFSCENQHWRFDYEGVSHFRDVRLVRQAAADVSGIGIGSIQISGRQIALRDGSIALLQNQGPQTFGEIRVQASESLTLTGTTLDASIATSLRQESLGVGDTGLMEITTGRLAIREGAQIAHRTLGLGNTGDIDIRAFESSEISGASPINPSALSMLLNMTLGWGATGDIAISTPHLQLRGGGLISTITLGSAAAGNAGNVFVNATEAVEVIGVESTVLVPTSISSSTSSVGDAGNVTVNTSRAILRDGGRVGSFTFASGNSGRLVLNATEWVEVSGTLPGSVNPSLIDASAIVVDEVTQQTFGFPPVPSGSPGDVEINTPQLNVTDGGLVTVRNDGTGRAGSLQVNAESVFLDEGGSITASTQSGEGGNIVLRVDDSLQLRRASQISAEAGGTGNGGNVTISADTIALLEGSSIDANAFEGAGGNIEIVTQGLFLSPDSRITASSQLGVDGLVTVTQLEIDTRSALVQLSSNPIDPATQVVSSCEVAVENTFVVTGNGGLPPDPTQVLRGQTVWVDTRLSDDLASTPPAEMPGNEAEESSFAEAVRSTIEPPPLVEATGWQRREDGTVELVSTPQVRVSNRWFEPGTCRD